MTRFVVLTADDTGIELVARDLGDIPRCQGCGRALETAPDAYYRIEISAHDQVLDLMHAPPFYVAGPRFVEWIERRQLSGLAFAPLAGDGDLTRLTATSAASLEPGIVTVDDACDSCGYRHYAVEGHWALDEGSWDGSPFFTLVERSELVFCTAEAAEQLAGSGLAGPSFMPPEVMA
jgi:hypothetical protein